jgi:hypothetical protein
MQGHGNRAKGKRCQSVIAERLEAKAALAVIVDALIDKAMDGDLAAAKEIFDRMDGKPKQQVDLGGQEDNPIISEIKVRLVKADASAGS